MRKKFLFLFLILLGLFSFSLLFILSSKFLDVSTLPGEIAVVRLEGVVGSSVFGYSSVIDKKRVKATLNSLAEDPLVSAVVIEISSPGGDAASTQEIANAIKRLSEKKPVVTFSSDVAASGGYWLFVSGNKTVLSPLSIVGSIGVVSESIDASKLLDKLGVNITTTKAGKYKDAGSISRPLSEEERKQIQDLVDKVYFEFVSEVSRARKIPMDKMINFSQGQIFLGRDAVALGLADYLGDEETAVQEARKLAGCKSACVVREVPLLTEWEEVLSNVGSYFKNFFLSSIPSGFFLKV